MNLVWALHENGHIVPNNLVAVVGAGVSGITAAVALRAYNCSVMVFDQGGRPLFRQRGTTHRNVHPNINWWPVEDHLQLTTELPFLDWPLGPCNEVITTLANRWNQLKKESGDDLVFIPDKEIKEAIPVPIEDNRLTLKDANRETFRGFDAVVVASGFGMERTWLDFPSISYWEPDGLESLRDNNREIVRFVVSGFGDGGQIDALRIAFDFDFGKLSFRIAEALSNEVDLTNSIKEIESHHRSAEWAAHSMAYEALAQEILSQPQYEHLRTLLRESFHATPGLVILIDEAMNSPYGSGAAPTHKLMIAYAKLGGTLVYKRDKIEAADDPAKFKLGGTIYARKDTHVVIRHGADAFQGELLTHDEWTSLESAQRNSAEYSYKPAWGDGPYPVPHGWPCRKRDVSQYIASLCGLAQKAFANMGSSGKVIARSNQFLVLDHDLKFSPRHIFGMPVKYMSWDEAGFAIPL